MSGVRRILLAETEAGFRRLLEQVAGPISDVVAAPDFQSARAHMLDGSFDLLLTNVRLRAHNGLHLIYLLRAAALPTRTLVYSDPIDPFLAREAQRAGAFYEPMLRLPYSLPAYLPAQLPPFDRRDPTVCDRRAAYRGGRRRSDVPLSSGARAVWI